MCISSCISPSPFSFSFFLPFHVRRCFKLVLYNLVCAIPLAYAKLEFARVPSLNKQTTPPKHTHRLLLPLNPPSTPSQDELAAVQKQWRHDLLQRRQQQRMDVPMTCSDAAAQMMSYINPLPSTAARHHLPSINDIKFDVKTKHPRLHAAMCQLVGGEVTQAHVTQICVKETISIKRWHTFFSPPHLKNNSFSSLSLYFAYLLLFHFHLPSSQGSSCRTIGRASELCCPAASLLVESSKRKGRRALGCI